MTTIRKADSTQTNLQPTMCLHNIHYAKCCLTGWSYSGCGSLSLSRPGIHKDWVRIASRLGDSARSLPVQRLVPQRNAASSITPPPLRFANAPGNAASHLQRHGSAPIHSGVFGTLGRRYTRFPNAWNRLSPSAAGSPRCLMAPGARRAGPQRTEYGPQRVRSTPSFPGSGDSAMPIPGN